MTAVSLLDCVFHLKRKILIVNGGDESFKADNWKKWMYVKLGFGHLIFILEGTQVTAVYLHVSVFPPRRKTVIMKGRD